MHGKPMTDSRRIIEYPGMEDFDFCPKCGTRFLGGMIAEQIKRAKSIRR